MKPEILCYSLPKQMEEYMKYVYNLSFDGEPDYTYLRRLFKSILDNSNRNINILKSLPIDTKTILFIDSFKLVEPVGNILFK